MHLTGMTMMLLGIEAGVGQQPTDLKLLRGTVQQWLEVFVVGAGPLVRLQAQREMGQAVAQQRELGKLRLLLGFSGLFPAFAKVV